MRRTTLILIFFVVWAIGFLTISIIAFWLSEYETYRQMLQNPIVLFPLAVSFFVTIWFMAALEMDLDDKAKQRKLQAERDHQLRIYQLAHRR